MITYRYKGLTSSGANVEGVVEAFDKQDALMRAKENCRVLISVEPVSGGKVNDIMNADLGALLSGGKIKPKKLTLLCSQLSIELRAGLPLVSALRLVAENEEDKNIKRILNEVADDVHAGNGLADSFAARGPGLPRTFIETIRAGEESGKLEDTLNVVSEYYTKEVYIAVKKALDILNPCITNVLALMVVFILLSVYLPIFSMYG